LQIEFFYSANVCKTVCLKIGRGAMVRKLWLLMALMVPMSVLADEGCQQAVNLIGGQQLQDATMLITQRETFEALTDKCGAQGKKFAEDLDEYNKLAQSILRYISRAAKVEDAKQAVKQAEYANIDAFEKGVRVRYNLIMKELESHKAMHARVEKLQLPKGGRWFTAGALAKGGDIVDKIKDASGDLLIFVHDNPHMDVQAEVLGYRAVACLTMIAVGYATYQQNNDLKEGFVARNRGYITLGALGIAAAAASYYAYTQLPGSEMRAKAQALAKNAQTFGNQAWDYMKASWTSASGYASAAAGAVGGYASRAAAYAREKAAAASGYLPGTAAVQETARNAGSAAVRHAKKLNMRDLHKQTGLTGGDLIKAYKAQ
jgi:hypothetical protein